MIQRGQAAMEFLMTYGWAILVVLAAIAALAYFGVLSPDRFMPEKCTLQSGLACLDATLTTGGAKLSIQNSLGVDAKNVTVGLIGTGCTGNSSMVSTLNNGNSAVFNVTCAPASGTKYKGTVAVTYANADTTLSHTLTGELIRRVP